MISLHRRALNALLRAVVPVASPSLEIGNGAIRRGMETGATWTVDRDPRRRPSVIADAHALPFRSGAFAAVMMFETLQYVEWPDVALRECWRVLSCRGRLLLSVPFLMRSDAPTDRWRWTERGIEWLVTRAGFRLWRLSGITVFRRLTGWLVVASAT